MLEVRFALGWNYKGQRGNETLFHTAIGNLQASLRDWSPAFRNMIEQVLEPGVIQDFQAQGEGMWEGRDNWAPLAASTVKRKGSAMILVNTGRMFASFFGGGDHIEEIGRNSMRWGSRLDRALFHQTGTLSGFQRPVKGPGRGIPMRKILYYDTRQKQRMRNLLVAQLATVARREGYAVGKGMNLDPLAARQIGKGMLELQ